ncbi:hypothetical protein T484DRAFT_1809703 [Baffinella frigidus]|nr:hypothetical protein T484DRAFT_1809703 [Cryptophyta sp. CCMP2293]
MARAGKEEASVGWVTRGTGCFSGPGLAHKADERHGWVGHRFCCSIASFFCFGSTHFCDGCHKKWVDGAFKRAQSLVTVCKCGTKHPNNATTIDGEHCFGCSLCRLKLKEAAPV